MNPPLKYKSIHMTAVDVKQQYNSSHHYELFYSGDQYGLVCHPVHISMSSVILGIGMF